MKTMIKRINMRRIISAVTVLVMVLSLPGITVQPADAAAPVRLRSEKIYLGNQSEVMPNFEGVNYASDKITIRTIKSSDTAVLNPVTVDNVKCLRVKKTGKAKITVTFILNGRERTSAATYKVLKYPSYISKLAVNGKDVTVSKNRYTCSRYKCSKTRCTVSMAVKKGWKIDYASVAYYDRFGYFVSEKEIKPSVVRTGKNIAFPARYGSMTAFISSVNETLGTSITYEINCVRGAKYPCLAPYTLWARDTLASPLKFDRITDGIQIDSVKSADTSIIKVSHTSRSKEPGSYYLVPGKAGKCGITATYTLNGKQRTVTSTFEVRKYPAPIKSLTINGKAVNIKKNKYSCTRTGIKATKVKVRFELDNDWKIVNTWVNYYDESYNFLADKTIENSIVTRGSAISFPKKYANMDVGVNLINSEGETLTYLAGIGR